MKGNIAACFTNPASPLPQVQNMAIHSQLALAITSKPF